jgi:PA domain/PEP-CTERM motif
MRKALISCIAGFALTLVWASSASAAILQQITPIPTTYVLGFDFSVMTFSAIGDETAPLVNVDLVSGPPSTSGCEATDFAGFTPGSIALMQRGTCSFDDKAANAAAAGAVGALIFNNVAGFLPGTGDLTTIMTMGLTRDLGLLLASLSGVEMRMEVNSADLPVPEPSTLGLIGLGLLGLTAMKRRRRRFI